ncbi:PfkB family carbohydrate kinase [Roseomonas sp. OT10]|uniref:PfkB family carbohydrate kinase n=1 Tax=Roseomonas cutis TaxID=2897332 RepID=UPI001E310FF0|nr:PfkB family carbohydrate kinase [Roseomonas sp. OT10]UFN49814.1 PfkB family carbohydrate kinase [Roseomonas sp. OT10]
MSRLCVLGNAGLDLRLPVPRLPRPGETLVGGAASRAPGGKGLNQAVAAARCGLGPVRFCAPLGTDAEGREVAARLAAEPLDATFHHPGPPTDLSVLLVSPDGENAIVTAGACADALGAAPAAAFAAEAGAGGWVLLQGNLSLDATAAALAAARAAGARCLLNLAPLRWPAMALLPGLDLAVANAVEARDLTGLEAEAAALALHRAGAAVAVVTLGAAGLAMATGAGVRRLPAAPARVRDTTGAGDAFCGVLAAMLAAGAAPEPALAAAQRAGARTVEREGAFDALPDGPTLRALAAA